MWIFSWVWKVIDGNKNFRVFWRWHSRSSKIYCIMKYMLGMSCKTTTDSWHSVHLRHLCFISSFIYVCLGFIPFIFVIFVSFRSSPSSPLHFVHLLISIFISHLRFYLCLFLFHSVHLRHLLFISVGLHHDGLRWNRMNVTQLIHHKLIHQFHHKLAPKPTNIKFMCLRFICNFWSTSFDMINRETIVWNAIQTPP